MQIEKIAENLHHIDEIVNELTENVDEIVYLNLHGNKITSLVGLPHLMFLTTLVLSSNNISSSDIPELAYLVNMSFLDLSGNLLTDIKYFPFLPGLAALSIAYNKIEDLSGLHENFPNLEELDCRGNLIRTPIAFSSVIQSQNLTRILFCSPTLPNPLSLQSNFIVKLFDLVPNLLVIDDKSVEEWRNELSPSVELVTPKLDKIMSLMKARLSKPSSNNDMSSLDAKNATISHSNNNNDDVKDHVDRDRDNSTLVSYFEEEKSMLNDDVSEEYIRPHSNVAVSGTNSDMVKGNNATNGLNPWETYHTLSPVFPSVESDDVSTSPFAAFDHDKKGCESGINNEIYGIDQSIQCDNIEIELHDVATSPNSAINTIPSVDSFGFVGTDVQTQTSPSIINTLASFAHCLLSIERRNFRELSLRHGFMHWKCSMGIELKQKQLENLDVEKKDWIKQCHELQTSLEKSLRAEKVLKDIHSQQLAKYELQSQQHQRSAKDHDRIVAELKELNRQSSLEIESLHQQLSVAANTQQSLEQTIQQTNNELCHWKDQSKMASEHADQQVEQMSLKVQLLEEDNRKLHDSLAEGLQREKDLKDQLMAVEGIKQSLTLQHQELQNQKSQEKERSNKKYDLLKNIFDETKKELDEEKTKNQDFLNVITELRNMLHRLRTAFSDVQHHKKVLEVQLQEITKQYQQQHQDDAQEAKVLQEDNEKLRKEVDRLKESLNQCSKGDFSSISTTTAAKGSTYMPTISSAEMTSKSWMELLHRLETAEKDIQYQAIFEKKMTKEIEEWKVKCQELEMTLKLKETLMKDQTAQIFQEKSKVQALESEKMSLVDRVGYLESIRAELMDEIQELEQQCSLQSNTEEEFMKAMEEIMKEGDHIRSEEKASMSSTIRPIRMKGSNYHHLGHSTHDRKVNRLHDENISNTKNDDDDDDSDHDHVRDSDDNAQEEYYETDEDQNKIDGSLESKEDYAVRVERRRKQQMMDGLLLCSSTRCSKHLLHLRDEITSLETINHNLQRELKSIILENETLIDNNDRLKMKINSLESEYHHQANEYQQQIEDMENEIHSLQDSVEEMEAAFRQKDHEYQELQKFSKKCKDLLRGAS